MVGRATRRPRARPRFELPLGSLAPEDVEAAIAEALRAQHCPVEGFVLRRNIELTTAARRQHVWSPHLTLRFSDDPEEPRMLLARFGPHSHVWTGFMAIYGVLTMVGVLGTMLGASQWLAAQAVWGFIIPPVALALGAFTYGASFVGQGLGSDEMYTLRAFVERCVEDARERVAGRAEGDATTP